MELINLWYNTSGNWLNFHAAALRAQRRSCGVASSSQARALSFPDIHGILDELFAAHLPPGKAHAKVFFRWAVVVRRGQFTLGILVEN